MGTTRIRSSKNHKFLATHFGRKFCLKKIQVCQIKLFMKNKKVLINFFLFFNSNDILGDGAKVALKNSKIMRFFFQCWYTRIFYQTKFFSKTIRWK